ncbi:YhcH/YjgK/YiaL family protein [Solitalea lacus]|uniref:YhcH/YjgK/YiaL family protein n=1 Tax=Solitalea lacus TaxID=2911172 RepID=UPI001EDB2124|nr:YhcH/YjgK/YiaL family protein [Solitalea lacus]UKJ06109.1 YhcH/YjgK/YiaL family protein [Solitalea lacus]
MIIDKLSNAERYYPLGDLFIKGFNYLVNTDFSNIETGKYEIEGEKLFAIVNEYETIDAANEKMEAHRKYIDIQFWISGEELVGHDILTNQPIFKEYDEEKDFLLAANQPKYFTLMQSGMFAIYFPSDLHMPCIKNEKSTHVKKVVLKVAVNNF